MYEVRTATNVPSSCGFVGSVKNQVSCFKPRDAGIAVGLEGMLVVSAVGNCVVATNHKEQPDPI